MAEALEGSPLTLACLRKPLPAGKPWQDRFYAPECTAPEVRMAGAWCWVLGVGPWPSVCICGRRMSTTGALLPCHHAGACMLPPGLPACHCVRRACVLTRLTHLLVCPYAMLPSGLGGHFPCGAP